VIGGHGRFLLSSWRKPAEIQATQQRCKNTLAPDFEFCDIGIVQVANITDLMEARFGGFSFC
jgi:hypothetical protein